MVRGFGSRGPADDSVGALSSRPSREGIGLRLDRALEAPLLDALVRRRDGTPTELLARIRAHLRQRESSEEALFRIGPYTFQPGAKHLIGEKGNKLRLTEKETAILRFLYRAGQAVISREVLLREVWGYNANVTTHTLETHIYRLRQKIERDPAKAQLLVTATGGYKLIP